MNLQQIPVHDVAERLVEADAVQEHRQSLGGAQDWGGETSAYPIRPESPLRPESPQIPVAAPSECLACRSDGCHTAPMILTPNARKKSADGITLFDSILEWVTQ